MLVGLGMRSCCGYSSDRQQIVVVPCYNINLQPLRKSEEEVRFDKGTSFSELATIMRINISSDSGRQAFSADSDVQFMKEVRDSDFSLSINYYQYSQYEVAMDMGFGPAGALTQDGLRVYGLPDNPNPSFGLICGDNYISSYKVGATLIVSLKLQFHGRQQKSSFLSYFEAGFASLGTIARDIQKASIFGKIGGKVSILAYQSGGNPSKLSNILNSTCGLARCAASCGIDKINDCLGAINGLLTYSQNGFPKQIDTQDARTLSPFSIGFAEVKDVRWIGLTPPKSVLNEQIIQMRKQLISAALKNQYYYDRVTAFSLSKLPWGQTSDIRTSIYESLAFSKHNIELLMDQSQGGITCFDDPETCSQNGQELLAKLRADNLYSLQYLNDAIKYKLVVDVCSSAFYRVSQSSDGWYRFTYDKNCEFTNKNFAITDTLAKYQFDVTCKANASQHTYNANYLIAKSKEEDFIGTREHRWAIGDDYQNTVLKRVISEYYFDLYVSP